jgi:hypothetical protein
MSCKFSAQILTGSGQKETEVEPRGEILADLESCGFRKSAGWVKGEILKLYGAGSACSELEPESDEDSLWQLKGIGRNGQAVTFESDREVLDLRDYPVLRVTPATRAGS